MLNKLRPRSVYDVCAALALFVALGDTAYVVNTVGSTDIIDGQVKSVDVGGTVSVWCCGQIQERIDNGQILALRVDGFN